MQIGRAGDRSPVTLTSDQRSTLERWVRARTTPQRLALRSRIVLLAANGLSTSAIAAQLATTRRTVALWCSRFTQRGPAGLERDEGGRGRKPRLSPAALTDALSAAHGTSSSIRVLARRLGVSPSAVHRAIASARASRQFRDTGDKR